MNHFHQPGVSVDYTPSGSDVATGDFVNNVGPGVGFADGAGIQDGVLGALLVAGVVNVDNPDDTAFALGATVGYDATNKKAVTGGAGDFDIGTAWYTYLAGSLYVQVAINGLVFAK